MNFIADFYTKQGFDFRIVTSAKNLIHALNRNNRWILQTYEKGKISSSKTAIKALKKLLEIMQK